MTPILKILREMYPVPSLLEENLTFPKTNEGTLLYMRLVWFAFLASIPLYINAGMLASSYGSNIRIPRTVFDVLEIVNLLYFAGIRVSLYPRARKTVQEHPEDVRAIRRWMFFWIILASSAEVNALLGVCLQIQDKALKPALPFYALAFLLLLSLWPRQIWSPEVTASRP